MLTLNVRKLFRNTFGAWQSATPRCKPRPTFRPRLETLEDRWLPSGVVPDAGTLTSTVWKPQLIDGQYSTDGNDAANWTKGLPSLVNLKVAYLDGSVSNNPVTFSSPLDLVSLNVQNGYSKTLTINDGATLTTEYGNFVNTGCTLTIVSADSKGIDLDGNNSFVVTTGANLILQDSSSATVGGTFLSAVKGPDGTTGGEYLSNSGTETWNGAPSLHDWISAPVLNAGGTFKANGNTSGNGSQLIIYGQDAKNTNNVSFYNRNGAFSLTNAAWVIVGNGFYQSGGTLTTDQTTCNLQAGVEKGDINIAGGSVTVDTVANTVGTLDFISATVEINGQINVNGQTLKDGNSQLCDLLDCGSAQVTLGAGSSLNVGTTGGFPLGTGNRWTVMKYGSYVNKWGTVTVPPTMTPSIGNNDILVSN